MKYLLDSNYYLPPSRPECSKQVRARLAQSVERKTLNLVVVGSSPTVGTSFFKEALMIETIDFSGHLEYKSVQRQLGRAV